MEQSTWNSPGQAIEAGARVIADAALDRAPTDHLRELSHATLDAAAPIIAAQAKTEALREAAAEKPGSVAAMLGTRHTITLRCAWEHDHVAVCLDAGVPVHDVQIAASHSYAEARPATTVHPGTGTGTPATQSRRSSLVRAEQQTRL